MTTVVMHFLVYLKL